MPFSLTWLPAVLRAAGLTVVEQPGWQTRGHGDVGTIKGVIAHHTADSTMNNVAPDLRVVTNGRPDLGGPLAQLVLGQDGTYYVIAAGKAWHAGAGLWQGVHDGNSQMIGIEAENTGLANNYPWPAVQMDSYAIGVAAILKHIGAKPIMCCGHLEWALPAGRKSDPSFSVGTRAQRIVAMEAFRVRVSKLMGAPAEHAVAAELTGTELTEWLQHALNDLGASPALKTDGMTGPKTLAAIKAFQSGHQLPATSIADAATLAAIREKLGHYEACGCGKA